MTAVEALQVFCGYAQIAKRLRLPCQGYLALSDSKFNDPQAGAETGIGAFLAVLAGVNSVSGPGMLDYVNCFSLEKLVFDDEIAGHALHFARSVGVKEDLPTQGLIEQLLADNHLLTSEHTLHYWPQEFYLPGPMVDRTNWDQWQEHGERKWRDRALEQVEAALESYDEAPLPRALHEEVRDLFKKTCKVPDLSLPAVEP
jgi:trimethylamine--corrinoid protein Co-methyltransferase